MSNIDRQLTNQLDIIHRETMGTRTAIQCRWYYDHKTDIYHCLHAAVYGKEVMGRMPDQFSGHSQAKEDWQHNPDSASHPL